jgi:hypothetical protein
MMIRLLRSAPLPARIELTAGALWLVGGVATAIVGGIFMTVNPPEPVVTPSGVVSANSQVIEGVLTAIAIGVAGALPSLGVGAVFLGRNQARALVGSIMAFLFAVVFLGTVVYATIDNLASASVDMAFLVIGILLGVTGLMHAASGVVGLRSRTFTPTASSTKSVAGG